MDEDTLEQAAKKLSDECECGAPAAPEVCKTPYYDAFDMCLVCSHDRTCHTESAGEA
jgi:hypothetical protein